MNIKNTFILLLTAFILTACASKQPLVSDFDESTSESQSQITEQMQTKQTSANDAQQTTVERLSDNMLNWNKVVSNTGAGGVVNILEKTDGDKYEPLSEKTVMQGGKVEAVLFCNIHLGGYESNEKVDVYYFVTVNGKLCEFELGGKKSSGGILCTQKPLNTDLRDVLTVTDCDLTKGENKLNIMYVTYYPQIIYGYPTKLEKSFSSDTQTRQSKIIETPQRYSDMLRYSQDKSELSKSTNFVFKQLKYDQDADWSEVSAGTDIGIKLINIDVNMTGSKKRDMLVCVMQNGKPIKLANGKKYLFLSLEQTDCSVEIPLTTLSQSGNHEYLTVCFFDMSDVIWSFKTDKMFWVK